ncbi:unnamed protein product [Rhizoctonia solani]|uniref:Secreted protein n=1 Tax=Rhizoctonia solani TaxID=456999 RepID=A0A8H3DVA6_9AGAM|nr:unnamed protein product [Rhizoctonia solani]
MSRQIIKRAKTRLVLHSLCICHCCCCLCRSHSRSHRRRGRWKDHHQARDLVRQP